MFRVALDKPADGKGSADLVTRKPGILGWLIDQFSLNLDDAEVARGQFRAIIQQVPLLYLVLAGNAVAMAIEVHRADMFWLTGVAPAVLAAVVLSRAVWWRRQRTTTFSDDEVRRYLRRLTVMAATLAAAFVIWVEALYPLVEPAQKGHLLFFLAITVMCCVFCLTPISAASHWVATIGMLPFIGSFVVVDGGAMWMEAVNLGLAGTVMMIILRRYHGQFNDLIRSQRTLQVRRAESQRLAGENRRIALTDALSGLPNRRALIARMEAGEDTARRGEVAVLFIDLDGFKQVNDSYGHELGDALICRVGEALGSLVPADAMLARMGGDEFAILLEGQGAQDAAHVLAAQILARLALPVEVGGHAMHIGASIGIAGGTGIDAQELMRRSDAAMYRAKTARAGVMGYDPSFDAGRERRRLVEAEIRLGLDRGEFDVAYQPLVDARTGAVVAVEALARWPGRRDGPLPPDEFITIAETSGLIHRLGLFVMRRACEDLFHHDAVRLNVNISPAQFRHPHFEAEVERVLAETGFPHARLQIEITEGYLVDHPERAARAIAAFRAMGVSVALDDFGSGFASIGYLRSFGFSAIKIDRTLSLGLGEDAKAALVVAGIVHLANGFDVDVTAEGVETETQAAMLRLAGCRELQGYLFGRPGRLQDVLPAAAAGPAIPPPAAALPHQDRR